MCYNCGCQMPNNDMGHPENITNKTFDEAAKAMGLTAKKSKELIHIFYRGRKCNHRANKMEKSRRI